MEENAKDKRGRRKPKAEDQRRHHERFFDDPARLASFFKAVEVFGNFSDACKYVNVDRRVIYDERDRNPEFAALLERAKLAMEFEAVEDVRKGKKDKNWRRAAWIAEKKNPRRWGRKDPQAVTPEMILAVTNRISAVMLTFVADERKAEAAAALSALLKEFTTPFEAQDPDDEAEERDDG